MRKKTGRRVFRKLAAAAALFSVLASMTLGSMTAQASSIITNETPQTGSLTLTKTDGEGNALQGAQFTLYKIMDLTPGQAVGEYAKYSVVPHYASELQGVSPDSLGNYSAAEIEAKVNELLKKTNSDTNSILVPATNADGQATKTGLALGYYLVVETVTPAGYVSGRPFFVAIPSTNSNIDSADGTDWQYDITVAAKNSEVPLEKKIIDEDDTLVDADTVTVGDNVNYRVQTTIPNYADEYFGSGGTVIFELKDTMSAGLSFNDDIRVFVDGTEVSESTSTWTHTASSSGYKLSFATEFLKANRGKLVEITYSAKVTEDAIIGTDGNTNKVVLEFSNNPQNLCKTDKKDDETVVYTFAIAIEKFAGSDYLEGAKFALYSDAACTQEVLSALTTDASGIITFERVAAGTYYLKELQSPEGYKLLTNPIKVEIEATYTNGVLDGGFTLTVDGTVIAATSGAQITRYDLTAGIATIAVENQKGFTVPETGGMGIILFLLVGLGGMAILSIVMIKKRNKAS